MKLKPPSFVRSREQKKYFRDVLKELVENKVPLKSQDVFALGTLAINLAILDECARSISEDGLLVKVQGDRNVISKPNPALALQKEAQTSVRFYYKELSMTPNSRTNTFVISSTKSDRVDRMSKFLG